MLRRIMAVLTLLSCLFLGSCAGETAPALDIYVLKIGKADAIILKTAASAVLIDTGESEDSAEILEKANNLGIQKFDCLILSHYDKDHVGGAAEVLGGIAVDQIIEPGYFWDSKAKNAYEAAVGKIPRVIPGEDMTFTLDGVSYTVLVPQQSSYADKNDYSLVVKAEFAGHTVLFAGDALDARTAELVHSGGIAADVLKVPHHGSYESGSEAFFRAVSPRYALITCSDKNPEDDRTVSLLESLGARILLTRNGDIRLRLTQSSMDAIQ